MLTWYCIERNSPSSPWPEELRDWLTCTSQSCNAWPTLNGVNQQGESPGELGYSWRVQLGDAADLDLSKVGDVDRRALCILQRRRKLLGRCCVIVGVGDLQKWADTIAKFVSDWRLATRASGGLWQACCLCAVHRFGPCLEPIVTTRSHSFHNRAQQLYQQTPDH